MVRLINLKSEEENNYLIVLIVFLCFLNKSPISRFNFPSLATPENTMSDFINYIVSSLVQLSNISALNLFIFLHC